ncbi:serine/threonine protein kinase [Streptomyces bambusae]|uniref:serine/threonine-protein kinase n=1 Tax=Streptomyces bambusae TaxID=1550616 RepID=UPI001CFE41F8|nr:serine/threonine-protein kinase [Streptomyces bambusae]MCB5169039.1 serine/threonine protein kinase [Streptomyces bambusae]
MQPLEAGDPRTIGAYRLLGRLGAGGMGVVYLGRSAGGRTVAVKIVHPHFAQDDEFRARFRREVAAARRVGGDWTAPVLDADPEAPVPWVATGFVAGTSLDRALAGHGPLPESSVRAIGSGLAEALAAVHALGLVHRDVKPSNVMLTLDGPRLIDFGIARATDGTASLTSTGVSVGSPGYMAPEQILGKGTTAAADVFSLGAVLVAAATGQPPFTGDNSATLLYKVVHEEPYLSDALTGPLRELLLSCLAKDPAARPAPAALAAALAPEGAAALIEPGWLPAPLVAGISKAAVRLLDLEPDRAPADASGPVPFGTPAYGGPGGTGGFGPPDPSYGQHGQPAAAFAAQPGNPYHQPTATAGAVPGPREAAHPAQGGGPATAGADTSPGGVSFTATAGRRVSCTVALAVAAAVAGVTVGGMFAFDLWPGGKDRGDALADGGKTGTRPPAATPDPSASAGRPTKSTPGTRQELPEAFRGTWKGTITSQNLNVSSPMEITITAGKVGEVVGKDRSVLAVLNADCSGEWKLVRATDKEIVLDSRRTGANPHPGICADGSPEETFTLKRDGVLHYVSKDAAAGEPTGDLTRSR